MLGFGAISEFAISEIPFEEIVDPDPNPNPVVATSVSGSGFAGGSGFSAGNLGGRSGF